MLPDSIEPATAERAKLAEGWLGYGALLGGIAAIALTLVAAGYGYGGWAVVGAVVAIVLICAGGALTFASQKRRSGKANRPHE